jgi:hypothetical protein
MGIREELTRGDYRALFLGWLADFNPDEYGNAKNGKAVLPPVPAGLDHLSPALKALIEHFPVDHDALAVAAGLSQASTPDRIPMPSVLEGLAVSEMRALLARVADGGGPGVMNELNRLTHPQVQTTGQTMKCADFAAKTIDTREVSRKKKAEAAAAKRQREAELRRQHLASIMQRADATWSGLDSLMDQKIASTYDQAASQLEELRDAYAQAGETGSFQQKLAAFRLRYSNRPAMLRRIKEL